MVSLTNFRSVSELSTQPDNFDYSNEFSRISPQQQQQQQQASPYANGNSKHNNLAGAQIDLPLTNKLNGSNGAAAAMPLAPYSIKCPQNGHFEIRWQNLTYEVEPKWYQKRWSTLMESGSNAADAQQQQQQHSAGSMSAQATRRTKTSILQSLNGSVKSGQVTAILGPSGAGKTSLLGCLTGKNKSGVSGCVQVISGRQEPMSICTIPQKDFLLNQLTVRENLWFASRLKHPEKGFDHDSNIERVLDLLKLESCINTKISKISGGQYKRVSIAQELLSNPDILILDEPTSGLDSLTCYKTVMVLRDLARLSPNPMAIIVTIHQPQREVFELFNHVYILAVGGRCIYEGQPSQSIRTINECSGGLHFDAEQYNPASYLVEIASAEFGTKPIEALVEHQRRSFQARIAAQDAASALANGAATMQAGGATPGLRKRQSPMVARFKSTLSSLAGSAAGAVSPRAAKRAHQLNISKPMQQQQQQQHTNASYTNEAYDASSLAGSTLHLQVPPAYAQLDPNNLNNNITTTNIHIDQNQLKSSSSVAHSYTSDTTSMLTTQDGEPLEEGEFYLDDRLQTHKHNHKGHFLRHCRLLTSRSWLCLCKDPMLTTLRFSAHIIVPLLITLVYGSRVGKPNACPLYETEMDLIDYARRGAKRLLNLQDELRCTFENVGLYFLSIYAFTFSTMCLTSLSFPLNMHVLLKEVRNGWYSIPTYFIGKTLADFPLEFILPTLTLIITYPLTGQPSSYLEWRFFLATGIFVVTSLIAQTQGLIFGALFMNAMQAAVFVAPVSTTPLILLSGFLIRISQMPAYLQALSSLSYFRYAIESLTIIRYGFGQCPCDPSVVTGEPVSASGVPEQLKTMTNYWLSTFNSPAGGGGGDDLALNNTAALVTTTLSPLIETTTEQPIDFFQDLTVLLARANSFGADIKTCKDLKPYPMIDFSLNDDQLYVWVAALVATLFASKVVNYLVVKYSVKWRL